jgi:hypothetical protein
MLQAVRNRLGSARVSRVGSGVAPKQSFVRRGGRNEEQLQRKFAIARMRSPARETRALPKHLSITRAFSGTVKRKD